MLRAFGFLLRVYSYLFHLILSLFLIGIAVLAYSTHQQLNLKMLPFPDDRMLFGVALLGAAGLVAIVLASTRMFRFVFPLWGAAVVYLLIRGFLFSSYRFPGAEVFRTALWLMLAAILALVGAVLTLRRRRGRLYR